MFTVEVMKSGALRLSADAEGIEWIQEQVDLERDSDTILMDGMERYWANGGFVPFDAGLANPFVGLTSAPCIAESMDIDERGIRAVRGGLWFYNRYMLDDPMEVLKRVGSVVFDRAH